MSFIVCTALGAILLITCSATVNDAKVKLVTVVFRHGDRTPDAGTLYPRDPYINTTYMPYGIGQLTTKGKQREYAIGKILRSRYSQFLGDTYFPGSVEAISTNMNRTKASLALVLASLYPPTNTALKWNEFLNWDPIPYNYLSYEKDLWMSTSLYFCPNYALAYDRYLNSPSGREIIKKNVELFEFLTDNTGKNITTPMDAWLVYSCLLSQDEWGLKLPLWTKAVYPDLLEKVTVEALRTFVATVQLKQLSGGLMLKRLINNMRAKVLKKTVPENMKIHLWSAHDINILYLSGALNQPINHSVPYGAYYIIELVESGGINYVSIYTIDYITLEQVHVKIPGCDFLCPFNQFVKLLERNIPLGVNPCGTDLSHVNKYHNRRNYYLGEISHKSIVDHYVKIVAEEDELPHVLEDDSDIFE